MVVQAKENRESESFAVTAKIKGEHSNIPLHESEQTSIWCLTTKKFEN
jgi:hypothetical protein